MYHRIILTALAITYLICVLLLSGIEKEDLDENTLSKLQRHNVNFEDVNNVTKYQECMAKVKLQHDINLTKTQETISQHRNTAGNSSEQYNNVLKILTNYLSQNSNATHHRTLETIYENMENKDRIETTTPRRLTETVNNDLIKENSDDISEMWKLYNDFQNIKKKVIKKEKNTLKSEYIHEMKHEPNIHTQKDDEKSKVPNDDANESTKVENVVKLLGQHQGRINSKPSKVTANEHDDNKSQMSKLNNFKNFWEMFSTFQDFQDNKDQKNIPNNLNTGLLPKLKESSDLDISGTSLRRNNDNGSFLAAQMDVLSKRLAQQYIIERNKQTTTTETASINLMDMMSQIKDFIAAKTMAVNKDVNDKLILNNTDTSSKTLALNSETLDYVRFIKPPDRDLVIDIINNHNRSSLESNSTILKNEFELTERNNSRPRSLNTITTRVIQNIPKDEEAEVKTKLKQDRTTVIDRAHIASNPEGIKISLLPQETLQEIVNEVTNKVMRDLKGVILDVTPVSTTMSTTMMTTRTKTTESPRPKEYPEAKILFDKFSHLFEKLKNWKTFSSSEANSGSNVVKKHDVTENILVTTKQDVQTTDNNLRLPHFDHKTVFNSSPKSTKDFPKKDNLGMISKFCENNKSERLNPLQFNPNTETQHVSPLQFLSSICDAILPKQAKQHLVQTSIPKYQTGFGILPRVNEEAPYTFPPRYSNSQASFNQYQMQNEKIWIAPLTSNIQQSVKPYRFRNPQSPVMNYMPFDVRNGIPDYPSLYAAAFNQRAKPAYNPYVEQQSDAQQINSLLPNNPQAFQTPLVIEKYQQPMDYSNPLSNTPESNLNAVYKQSQTNTLNSNKNNYSKSTEYLEQMPQQTNKQASKQIAITIQTNSGEIEPLGIPIRIDQGKSLNSQIQNQNIIVTTERPRGSRAKTPPKAIGIEEKYDEYKYLGSRARARHHTFDNEKPRGNTRNRRRPPFTRHEFEDTSANKESYAPSYRDSANYRYNPDRYERIENGDGDTRRPRVQSEYDQPRSSKHYSRERYGPREARQRENRSYRDRVQNSEEEKISRPSQISTRYQKPIKARPKYDDTHFKNFIKTQQKVNAILENILGGKPSKPKNYRDDFV